MDTVSSIIDISEVLGPGWAQDIRWKKRLVILTFSCSVDLRVALEFDRKWVAFRMVHEVPPQPPLVNVDYMNEYEGYYFGLYLLMAGQKPLRDWIESIRDACEEMGEPL